MSAVEILLGSDEEWFVLSFVHRSLKATIAFIHCSITHNPLGHESQHFVIKGHNVTQLRVIRFCVYLLPVLAVP